jgi:hypothetical protein
MRSVSKIKWWHIFQITVSLALGILFLIQWENRISTPTLRNGADFISFYTAARIAQEKGLSSVYNASLQHDLMQEIMGKSLPADQFLPYNHMPYLVPFLELLVSANYVASFQRWVLVMLLVYAVSCLLLWKTTFPAEKNSGTALLGMLIFLPFVFSLFLGQDTALLFAGIVFWYLGWMKNRPGLIAAGLALVTLRPHLALALSLPLFVKNRQAGWRFLAIVIPLALLSIFLIGKQGTVEFVHLLFLSAQGNAYGMNQHTMPNLLGLLWRLFPQGEPTLIHSISWLAYLAGTGILIFLWHRAQSISESLIGISIIIVLFTAPHLRFHDLTLLILPLLFVLKSPFLHFWRQHIALTFTLLSLILLPPILQYTLPYIFYAGLIIGLGNVPLPRPSQHPAGGCAG